MKILKLFKKGDSQLKIKSKKTIMLILGLCFILLVIQAVKISLVDIAILKFNTSEYVSVDAETYDYMVFTTFNGNGVQIQEYNMGPLVGYSLNRASYIFFNDDDKCINYYNAHDYNQSKDIKFSDDWEYEDWGENKYYNNMREKSILYTVKKEILKNPFAYKLDIGFFNHKLFIRLGKSFDRDKLDGYMLYFSTDLYFDVYLDELYFDLNADKHINVYYYDGDFYKEWEYYFEKPINLRSYKAPENVIPPIDLETSFQNLLNDDPLNFEGQEKTLPEPNF